MKKSKSLMKKNEAMVIGAIIAIMVIILVVVIIISRNKNANEGQNLGNAQEDNYVKEEFVERQEDGTRVNTSSKLAETKTGRGYEISNITLSEKGNLSVVRATITNTTSEKRGDEFITLVFVDKEGNTLTETKAYLDTLQPGASATLSVDTSADFANAYDYRIQ